jgi:hypothetical protein
MSSTYIQVFLSEIIVNVVNSELGALGLPVVHEVRGFVIVDRCDSLVWGFAAAARSRRSAIVWIRVKGASWAGRVFKYYCSLRIGHGPIRCVRLASKSSRKARL